ncbi:hypothetical protein KL928_003784 [Ogataea angusta]|uniref:Zn(2)-C6 fungal-type domain-containing protein n=1 Tax=Pichia angusta TaxID=870730 RepID=A0AAN6I4M1_PICAN|nr:uncharacterized protein KL928_003784 [Ogataea angusta]KAG7817885.1 hypothetical protein KL928_003784 [Ogataea angusta]
MKKTRVSQQKSRGGCNTCKRNKIKCDEHKPHCHNCLSRGIECGGYTKVFKFKEIKSARGGRANSASNSEDTDIFQLQPSDSQLSQVFHHAAQSITGKTCEQLVLEQHLARKGKNPRLASELETVLREFRGKPSVSLCPSSSSDWLVKEQSPFLFEVPQLPYSFAHHHKTQFVYNSFDVSTSNVLCVYVASHLNPWRTEIMPLADKYPIIFDLLGMIVCSHLGAKNPDFKAMGLEFKVRAYHQLSRGLTNNLFPNDICLMSCILLALDEFWDNKSRTDLSHLRSASYFVDRRLRSKTPDPRFQFLLSAWQYMRVISRTTLLNPALGFRSAYQPRLVSDGQTIDHIMGMSQELFAILDSLIDAIELVKNVPEHAYPPDLIEKVRGLQYSLVHWEPPKDGLELWTAEEVADHKVTAQSYRYATLILLQNAFPQVERYLGPRELSFRVREELSTLRLSGGASVVMHVFPLFMAACEAFTAAEKQWFRTKTAAVFDAISSNNIKRMTSVMEEVWKRKCLLKTHYESLNMPVAPDDHLLSGLKSYASWFTVAADWKIDIFVG